MSASGKWRTSRELEKPWLTRPQARRPARARQSTARRVLPLFRTGHAGRAARRPLRQRTAAGQSPATRSTSPFGRRLSIHEEIAERLNKKKGAGDLQLGRDQLVGLRDRRDPARAGARRRRRTLLSLPIAIAIALLLAVVSISYRQISYAYPSGGGAYAVARANLPGSSP